MTKFIDAPKRHQPLLFLMTFIFAASVFSACNQSVADKRIKQIDPARSASMAKSIESLVKPQLADGLSLSLWGIDSLVISPIAIDIDDSGKIYYTTTNRQKNSEFDIRAHQNWEIPSIQLQTVEDKRAFLHKELSPENSSKNGWLTDVNGDGSHDWRDMTLEKENVYRLEDVNGDGVADKSQLVVDDFHDEVTDVAGGVLVNDRDLFVAVGPDLWRLKDKDGDGIADEKTSISKGYGVHVGFSGHGMSGVEMGPDGRIYWQIGDIGFNGVDQTGKKWSHPNSGVVARSNPDGSDFEIFAAGLRNTHEFVFDEYANLISEDNDGDHAGERERLVYIVNGSDAGWRSNWQYGKYNDPDNNGYKVWMDEKMWMPGFKGQPAHIIPCISNYVNGPTGMLYNPGTALSPAYKNTFFVVEFVGNPAKSGIYGFKLNPSGAGFKLGENKKLLGGILPTGIDFGPDGALYLADWIDGWGTHDYGRIWKLDDKAGATLEQRAQTKSLLVADLSKYADAALGELLSNPDMRVRLKAQFELVKRGPAGIPVFEKALGQTVNQLARVNAIWGISQLARKDKKHAKLLFPYLRDKDTEIRAQSAKWLGDMRSQEAGNYLLPLLKDTSSRVRFFAAEALGRAAFEPAIQPIIEMLRLNDEADVYLRHAGCLALASIGKAAPLAALSKHSSRALRIAAVVALRRMGDPGVAVFLNDTDEFVVTEAARAINDDLSIKAALPALGNILKSTSFKNEALVRRAINANLRVGTDQALQNLLDYSVNAGAPATMRAEAIETISTWAKPSVLDRVDGRYRGSVQKNPLLVKTKAGASLLQLLGNKELPIRVSAIRAIRKLGMAEASTAMLGLLKSDQQPLVRAESLKALAAMQDAQISQAITLAISDKDKTVRTAGIELIGKMNIPKELMVTLLLDVVNTKTTQEKQQSLLTLGKLPVANTLSAFDGLLQKMAQGQLPADIQLELAEAIDSSHSAALMAKYKKIAATLSPDVLAAEYSGSLYGGDPEQGRDLFYYGKAAQCMRCHAYGDIGGNAGPRLNGVGKRLTRQLILESLINPSAKLAPGFGLVTVTLKNGKMVAGILEGENNSSLTVKEGNQPNQVIQKDQIAKRVNAASSMPEIKNLLSKKEIRDMVSFLSTLKED
jgi:putative heme-binding domain-containing protein